MCLSLRVRSEIINRLPRLTGRAVDALQTGELFQTREVTNDGRSPRFSPDGRLIAYESGLEASRRTRIVRNDPGFGQVADLPGVSATFSPTTAKVAYLKIADTDDLRQAAQAVERASLAVVTVAGDEKREPIRRIRAGEDLPGGRIRARQVLWLGDRAALEAD